jgi:membrane protease YdiL (CAAX protease family)
VRSLGRAESSAVFRAPSDPLRAPLVRAAAILLLLAGAIAVRWAATVDAAADGLLVGAAFGTALVGVAALVGWRPPKLGPRQLAAELLVGLAGGAALVGLALAVRWPGPWIPFDPAGSFVPWAAVTVLVATGEEVVLRGALFDALDEAGGIGIALVATALVFALLHVPLYGWHVVPLDLGVGLFLGGLRVVTGGVAAPSVAHAVADLATWWI